MLVELVGKLAKLEGVNAGARGGGEALWVGGLEDDLSGATSEVHDADGGELVPLSEATKEEVDGDPGKHALLAPIHDLHRPRGDEELGFPQVRLNRVQDVLRLSPRQQTQSRSRLQHQGSTRVF